MVTSVMQILTMVVYVISKPSFFTEFHIDTYALLWQIHVTISFCGIWNIFYCNSIVRNISKMASFEI